MPSKSIKPQYVIVYEVILIAINFVKKVIINFIISFKVRMSLLVSNPLPRLEYKGPNDPFGLQLFNTGNTMITDKDECRYISIIQAMCFKGNLENILIRLYLEKNHVMRLLETLSYNTNAERVLTNQVYPRQRAPHLTASDDK